MKNNWYVLTGAPSSGKTTVLEELKKKGYKVYEEWARVYIDQEIKSGRSIQEIRKDESQFQEKILDLKVNFEKTLHSQSTLFLDRGIPDSIAYMKLCGIPIKPQFQQILKKCSYKKVFLLELLEYKIDYARTESQKDAFILDSLLKASYKDLGMELIKVPKMSVEKRVNFIIKNL